MNLVRGLLRLRTYHTTSRSPSNRDFDSSLVHNLKHQYELLRSQTEDLQKTVKSQDKIIQAFKNVYCILELGDISNSIKFSIRSNIFKGRPQQFKSLLKLEEAADNKDLTEKEIGRWNHFRKSLEEKGVSIKQLEEDIAIVTRNYVAHRNVGRIEDTLKKANH